MVFGELVDAVPILGSQRRVYVLTGGVLIAAGLLMLAGAAGGWLTFTSPENIYRIGSFLNIVGVVLQDVTADAMSTEVVARTNPDGTLRPKEEVNRDLGMVQVLGRLALSFGMFSVAGIFRLARQHLLLRDRVPHGPHHPRHLRDGRHARQTRQGREPAGGLAHTGWRALLRHGGGAAGMVRGSLQSGDRVCRLDGRSIDAHARRRRSRHRNQAQNLLCGGDHLRVPRGAAGRLRLHLVHDGCSGLR